ncbi:putative leucine-rich repeat receptor-like serine/threonine-protein kinase [Acorus gramineus]|uniref:Leucine-rich repeat receptor-like serine/threonine-protein kinase n=1 Tax=Acorus gramineus TaxID=55184 RepID=A0AAV9BWS5_ACOGR|nr:putative leucine-rich repeat receptor-like serine/threonine-protein kinase [Acorus gramineus]
MKGIPLILIIGIAIGVLVGSMSAIVGVLWVMLRRRRSQVGNSSSRRAAELPISGNAVDSSTVLSDITESPRSSEENREISVMKCGGGHMKKSLSKSGLPKYSYKDLQKATFNFTAKIGQGAFGCVYKAQLLTGETVAVKVLATNSREFLSEVLLLGRLHHKNLVNLVGYCLEKDQHILVYEYMSNGSLSSHLYGDQHEPLDWDMRVCVALDVARGLEYLHDEIIPPVVHRDIKSSNILLDRSFRARVADFGMSMVALRRPLSGIQGTYGYLDPHYISTQIFTKESDVYSFGVLLFELIAARSPQQGLMELVKLGAMSTEERLGWEDIMDPRLDGKSNMQELNEMAALAHRCINESQLQRPSMREVVLSLSQILESKKHQKKNHLRQSNTKLTSFDNCASISDHYKGKSFTGIPKSPEVC